MPLECVHSSRTDKSVNQPLHPLVNSSLLRCSKSYPSGISPYNLAAFYDIVLNVSQMAQTLRSILQRSNIARMGELTILEKSALQKKAANISESISSNLFAFLSAIFNALQTWSSISPLDLEEVGYTYFTFRKYFLKHARLP